MFSFLFFFCFLSSLFPYLFLLSFSSNSLLGYSLLLLFLSLFSHSFLLFLLWSNGATAASTLSFFTFVPFFSFLLLLVLLSLPPAEAGRLLAVTVDCSSFIATIKAARRHPAVTVQPGWIWYTGATSDQAFLHGTWSILLAGLGLNGIDDEME